MSQLALNPFVCPFCPLRCDDLQVRSDSQQGLLELVDDHGCQRVVRTLQQWHLVSRAIPAAGAGDSVWERAVGWLDQAATLEICGGMLDVQTTRAAVRFAARLKARLFAGEVTPVSPLMQVVERQGMVAATLGEVAARADSVVLIGDIATHYPRLINRFLDKPLRDGGPRRLAHIDATSETAGLDALFTDVAQFGDGRLKDLLSECAQQLHDGRATHPLVEWLLRGECIAWIWSPGVLDRQSASLLVSVVDRLNIDRRSHLIPLSDDTAMRTTSLWLTGFAGPLSFATGLPRLLESNATIEPDVRMWLQPYPAYAEPPTDSAKLIVIGMPGPELAARADAVIPAATPGVEASGVTLRGDGTISLPWQPPLAPTRDAMAEVLTSLADAVETRRGG